VNKALKLSTGFSPRWPKSTILHPREDTPVELVRNVMAHAQKPDLVFQRNGRVHLNRRGCQFSRPLAVKESGSADSDCIDRAPSSSSRLLATHSIRIFPLHFPPTPRASPCAIRFRTRYTALDRRCGQDAEEKPSFCHEATSSRLD